MPVREGLTQVAELAQSADAASGTETQDCNLNGVVADDGEAGLLDGIGHNLLGGHGRDPADTTTLCEALQTLERGQFLV